MLGTAHGQVTVELCSGIAGQPLAMDGPGMHGAMADHGKSKDHGKAEMPCAFSGLSAAALGAIDPIRLVALLAFVLAIGLVPAMLPWIAPAAYRWPPLRGPPPTL